MEVVKKTDAGTIYKKRNGRYGIKNKANKWINGEEKIKILVAEGLLKVSIPAPAPKEEAPAEEAAAEAPAEAVEEAPAE